MTTMPVDTADAEAGPVLTPFIDANRLEAKLTKELPLISILPPHHRRLLLPLSMQESLIAWLLEPFFDSIGQFRTYAPQLFL